MKTKSFCKLTSPSVRIRRTPTEVNMLKLMSTILCFASAIAAAKVKVVTTTTDLKALVQEVAKDKVDVSSIAKGSQDVHQIEAKPSYMVLMRDADLLIAQGLELESAWLT